MCSRIECMCRYSFLDENEINDQSMKDRNIIAGLYYFFRSQGYSEKIAAKKARINAIRLILNETFSCIQDG